MDNVPVQTAEGSAIDELQSHRSASRLGRKDRDFQKAASAVFRETRRPAARLRNLQSINPGTSLAFLSAMRHHIVQFAVHEAGVRILQRRLYKLYFYTFLLIYLISPLIILGAWLGLRFSLGDWISVYLIYAVSFIFLPILILPTRLITQRNLEELFFPWLRIPYTAKRKILRGRDRETNRAQLQWSDFVAISWVILIAAFSGYLFWRMVAERESLFTSNESMVFLAVFFVWSFWLLSGVLLFITGSIILYIRRRRLNTRHPQTMICVRLLEALSLVERHSDAWGEADFKQVLVEKLEDAALRVEFDLQRQQRSGDPATDAWLAQSFAGIARSLREQKKRILLPEPDARQALIDFLAQELAHAAAGDWGGLQRIEEANPAARRMGALKRLGGLLAAIVRGSLPLLALWLLQQSPFALQSNLNDYTFILAALYLLFSVLAEVDPLYRDKIRAVQELLNLTSRK